MPEIKDKLIVPVEVPAWGVICFLVSGAFAFGAIYNQLSALVKSQEKVDLMYERQIKNIEAVNRHEQTLVVHEQRITALERAK